MLLATAPKYRQAVALSMVVLSLGGGSSSSSSGLELGGVKWNADVRVCVCACVGKLDE